MIIKLSQIDFDNLHQYEKALSILTPVSAIGGLNSSLVFDIETKKIKIYLLDVTAMVNITMSCDTMSIDNKEQNLETIFGFNIDFKKFLYTIEQYKDSKDITLELLIEGEKSSLTIRNNSDTICLPTLKLENYRLDELNTLFVNFNWDENDIIFTSLTHKDFLAELSLVFRNSMLFINKDEKKNNAGVIYSNKFIVNDRRHIYIQNFKNICPIDGLNFPIHKKNMRIFSDTLNTEKNYTLVYKKEENKIFISTEGFSGILNNSIANAVPPSLEDLDSIRPITKVFESPASLLTPSFLFFSGFYTSSTEVRPISIKIKPNKNEMGVYLKDSGVAGFGQYSVEKVLITDFVNELEEEIGSTLIYDSIKDFLTKENDTAIIEIFMDSEHGAVYVKSPNQEIYLSKLLG